MDDEDPQDRALAMRMNHTLIARCDEMWVYQPVISAGMRQEILWAKQFNKHLRFFDTDFTEVAR